MNKFAFQSERFIYSLFRTHSKFLWCTVLRANRFERGSLTNIPLAFVTENSHSLFVHCPFARSVYIRLSSKDSTYLFTKRDGSTRTNVISVGSKASPSVWYSVIFIEMWIRVISHNDRFMYISLYSARNELTVLHPRRIPWLLIF